MKKILILIMSILLLSGCTSYTELSDMAIISTIALDKENDNYKIIIQVLDTKKSSKEDLNPSVVLYEALGKTIHEAFRNISLESSKKLYLGHLKAVIIKESVLKNNTNDFIDFILRNKEIDKTFDLLMTKDDIKDIMEIIPPLETIPSEKISKTLKIASKSQGMVDFVKFDSFLNNIYSIGIDPVLPIIHIKEIESNNNEINPKKRLVLEKNLAIFKDDKFINYLSYDSSIGYNLLNKSDTSSIISFECMKNAYISVELLNVIPKIIYNIDTKKLDINLDISASLSEINCNIDEEDIKLENIFNKRIENIIKSTIDEEKNNNVDYLGIGKYLYQNKYDYYKNINIDDLISNLESNININTKFIEKNTIKKGDEKY